MRAWFEDSKIRGFLDIYERMASMSRDVAAGASGIAVASVILVRELDERLGLGDFITSHMTDSRRAKRMRPA